MNIREFKSLTDDQLRQLADECLAIVDNPYSGQQQSTKLLQAQLYMNELDRRHDESIADRDYDMAVRSSKMEKAVIWLIGVEILIGVIGIWFGIVEGNKQARILDDMKTSTGCNCFDAHNSGEHLKHDKRKYC